ncbi:MULTISPECIES: tyrosine-type recombinase/integrase [unclassified Sphingobium]|uniref:tyrosine-type recombinase/integrase n=1 Tax=unclassified Sphingobium TaxID=2611147 RepID=UPI0015ECC9A2|nr:MULTISPECIES: site-specific integrase [unclassified Sphingobium]MCW2363054.1 integrase [Sphingobium sp. B10D3B]MCW2382930.1 integrase [Sphingobium sp. B2D3B]MCW2396897.1 integrase [Sphingobium sp. B2D3C]
MNWSVFDEYGCRKYLNRSEMSCFLDSAKTAPPSVHAFCRLLAETGCRISEALCLTLGRIDPAACVVIFESLKKRKRGIFRRVPISSGLVRLLTDIAGNDRAAPLWRWSRTTAWRHVHEHMDRTHIRGPQACPRGLRHGFAVAALGAGAPLNLVQSWLGHANIETTSIYAVAVGPEEREIVERIWSRIRAGDLAQRRVPSANHRSAGSVAARRNASPAATEHYFF